MANFIGGMGLWVLGFAVDQFSRFFNLYDAFTKNGRPVPYYVLRALAFILMAGGVLLMAFSLI